MITDRQIAYAYREKYEQGIMKKEVRSYEVSIWTLQDEFITVLKWSDVEHKGKIQDPEMILADDGTQQFKFSIPMYLYQEGKLIENPIWYNTRNGNLAVNLRKIKVIFNKDTIDKKIYEFMITKVTESHESDKLFCNVECEGLAFQELGKHGYTISLSLDDYDLLYKEWIEKDGQEATRPKQNVQFWCNQIGLIELPNDSNTISPFKWYYEIDMNYSRVGGVKRNTNIVYEEPYVAEWNEYLYPTKIQALTEKERTINVSESNIYNITQEIAKQFGIYCRYEYKHDINNHIEYKKVVFFNNCLHGDEATEDLTIGFTYPHSSKKISREIDSADIVTKLYVRSMEDTSTLLGEANISYCSANKTSENYILNFDYLKETGNLSVEQEKAISVYETEIAAINKELVPLQNKLVEYERKKIELQAKITTYQNSIDLDKEQITKNGDLARALVATYGNDKQSQYIGGFDRFHPDQGAIVTDKNGYYCINLNTKQKGIKPQSVEIYRSYSSSNQRFIGDKITNFKFEYDEYQNPIAIYGIAPENGSTKVYMAYDYEPRLYYDNIVKTWEVKLGNDQKNYSLALNELGPDDNSAGLNKLIVDTKTAIDSLLDNKKEKIARFDSLMGPTLREGYWQPEHYETYGQHYNDFQFLTLTTNNDVYRNAGTGYFMVWDSNLFDEEIDIKYESGINQQVIYYPCINLSNIYDSIRERIFEYSFIFNNNYYQSIEAEEENNINYIRNFAINENRGGEAVFSFVRVINSNQVYPALILVGAKNMTEDQINFMLGDGHPRLGIMSSTITNNNVITDITNEISLSDVSYWHFGSTTMAAVNNLNIQSAMRSCEVVYPRAKFTSLMLKTDPTNLYLRYNNILLEQYSDYYVRNRVNEFLDYAPEFLITIKPERLTKSIFPGTVAIDYVLSNASTSIYLDALKIEKENAYPKVSYTVDPNILNKSLISTLYNKLNWIIMINDAQLKLKEAFGYISKLTLNLDFPDKDSIEVKNYTTKFEDLFSTIVAQTENMQRNERLLANIARGDYALSGKGLADTLNNTQLNTYLNQYFTESQTVQEVLSNLFLEAGNILSDSSNSLNQVQSLTTKNATILSGFAERIQNELVPTVFRQVEQPDDFKSGDIWIEIDDGTGNTKNTYIAISDSDGASNGHGWMKTYEGSLSQIEGAVLNIDAQAGKIDIAAQDVNIVGNQSVNIGGTIINIGSNTINGTMQQGAVNIYATSYDSITESGISSSRVLIDPTQIYMAGAKITMLTGKSTGVSAIELDGSKGIWIGSSKSISLFATNNTGNTANVEINPDHILFGMNNVSNSTSTAIELTTSQILLGAGSNFTSLQANGITTANNIAGVQITSNKIALAIGSGTGRSAIIMDSNGLIIGAGANSSGTLGSLVTITGTLVNIGTNGNFNVNANSGKFIIKTNATGGNNMLYIANNATWASATAGIQYLANGTLNIKVSSLNIGTSSIQDYVDGRVTAASSSFKMTPTEIWQSVQDATASTNLRLTSDSLTLTSSGSISLNIDTNNYVHINSSGIDIKGKHIKINGQQEWSRDDIIIMNPNATGDNAWRKEVSTIETRQTGKHDWVLIKPYYDASWSYIGSSLGRSTQTMESYVTLFNTTYTDAEVFGTVSSYTYKVAVLCSTNQTNGNSKNANLTLKLTGVDATGTTREITGDTDTFQVYSGWAWKEITITSSYNLLGSTNSSSRTISLSVINNGTGYRCMVDQGKITASCDAVNSSRVPCTVYYYR